MADNRQFTDHNEIGGVNVYLEDKKLAESPEQNTVATTDYVLLKDTDGVPHKISKANMMSVVKDALADLLKNNDLGASVTNVPALNASAFGSATVANLASVLGVFAQGRSMLESCDLNSMTGLSKCGVWLLHPNYTYTNNNGISNGCLMVFSIDGGGRHFQVVFDGSLNHIYGRIQWVGNWGEWKQIM